MKLIFLGAAALIGLYLLQQRQAAEAAQDARYDFLREFKQTFTPGGAYIIDRQRDLIRTGFLKY